MTKLSKTTIGLISVGSAVVIAGSTILVNVAFKKEEGGKVTPINPLNRGNEYHNYSLVNKIQANTKLNNVIDVIKNNNHITYVINEQKFKTIFKTIVQDTLKSIPTFSLSYLNYVIECNYKIKNTKSILIDLVWYEPDSKIKFYDQFEMCLLTA